MVVAGVVMAAAKNKTGERLVALWRSVVTHFNRGDWEAVGLLTDTADVVAGHSRLLRSLSFGDSDYSGCALEVLQQIVAKDPSQLKQLEAYVKEQYDDRTSFVSAKPTRRKLTFAPVEFQIPDDVDVEPHLIALMIPFDAAFNPVSDAVKSACARVGFDCKRADDIWESSILMEDVFGLIVRSRAVVVDFTGKNANVMYETGIAHALGKLVVPIAQSIKDVPFDVIHHRTLPYLANREGLGELEKKLAERIAGL